MDLTKVTIHSMQLGDLEQIKEILQTDFDDLWNFEIFQEELGNTNSSYFVLRYEDEIVCFGGIKIIFDEATLMNLVTKKDKRHQGFAKLVLNELFTVAKQKHCSSMTLEVRQKNTYAIALYQQFGFQEVGRRKNYYSNGDTAILMTCQFPEKKE